MEITGPTVTSGQYGDPVDATLADQRARHKLRKNGRFTRDPRGAVYVMSHHALPGMVKVGKSRDPFARLSDANVWCPLKGWVLEFYEWFDDSRQAEFNVHVKLGLENRRGGEWFAVSVTQAIEEIQGEKRNEADHS